MLLLCAFLQSSSEFLNLHILDGQEVLQAMDLHLQELDRFLRLKDDLVPLCQLHTPASTSQPLLLTLIHSPCVAMGTEDVMLMRYNTVCRLPYMPEAHTSVPGCLSFTACHSLLYSP